MDEIEIQCDWSKIPRQKYSNLLAKRFYGWLPQILIPVTGVMTAFLVILVLRAIVNPTDLPASWAVAFVPFYLGYIVAKLMNDYWKRRLFKALGSAEIRRQGQSIFLSKHGISISGFDDNYPVGWPVVTEVVETKDTTLLLMSPTEYFPLPDEGLPSGLTRPALLEQIAEWRRNYP